MWAVIALFSLNLFAQKQPEWDNTSKSEWNPAFSVIDIPSTKDGSLQKAYFYKSTDVKPQPLIISLHTWSGNYTQKDPLTKEILDISIRISEEQTEIPNSIDCQSYSTAIFIY